MNKIVVLLFSFLFSISDVKGQYAGGGYAGSDNYLVMGTRLNGYHGVIIYNSGVNDGWCSAISGVKYLNGNTSQSFVAGGSSDGWSQKELLVTGLNGYSGTLQFKVGYDDGWSNSKIEGYSLAGGKINKCYNGGSGDGWAFIKRTELTSIIYSRLNLKVFLQGLYIGNQQMTPVLYNLGLSEDPGIADTITVCLWSDQHLSNQDPDYCAESVLFVNGKSEANFPLSVIGGSYYIVIRHRASLETWSKQPYVLTNEQVINFTN